MEAQLEAWQEKVRAASAAAPLVIQGGGSKHFYGNPCSGDTLDTRSYCGIQSYEPTELVVTVRAGTPLEELKATLSGQGQMLAFEPPEFGLATVGGMLACGLSGPRRAFAGAVRDHVLGVRIIDGRGDLLRFGGQVMKNVAGYDVSRLMIGAQGTLGLIVEASIKVLPVPAAERTRMLSLGFDEAVRCMNQWGGRPLPISATCWCDGVLHVRLSGAFAAVRSAADRIGGEAMNETSATDFWSALREHRHPFFAGQDAADLWRLSVPSTAPALPGCSSCLVEWGGALRWVRSAVDDDSLQTAAAQLQGSAMLFRPAGKPDRTRFGTLEPAVASLHRRLKHAFDPRGVLNPGRLYPDW